MMKPKLRNFFGGLCVTALFLTMSSHSGAQVLAHSGDVAGYVGYLHVNYGTTLPSDNHAVYHIDGGYNLTPHVEVMGEWAYGPLGTFAGGTAKAQIFGGGARFNLMPDRKLVPYALVTFGGDRDTWSGNGTTLTGYYVCVGGGASYYVGQHWGVRPELRYVRAEFGNTLGSDSANAVTVKGGVFYQWGGAGNKKKVAIPQQ